MRRPTFLAAFAGLTLIGAATLALAEPVTYDLPEETAVLKTGPGLEAAQSNCTACHSADYLAMQPPRATAGYQSRAFAISPRYASHAIRECRFPGQSSQRQSIRPSFQPATLCPQA